MDTGEVWILTLQDLFEAVDWSKYAYTSDDSRVNEGYRCVLLKEAFYGEMKEAREEAIIKLGDAYLDARKILEDRGFGYQSP